MTRFCTAWFLYWLGHVVSRLMQWWDWGFGPLYPIYSWCMNKSVSVQGDGKGPWYPVGYGDEE